MDMKEEAPHEADAIGEGETKRRDEPSFEEEASQKDETKWDDETKWEDELKRECEAEQEYEAKREEDAKRGKYEAIKGDEETCDDEAEQPQRYLDLRLRSEINLSIDNLKHTLINSLEKILRQTSKHFTTAVNEKPSKEVGDVALDDLSEDSSKDSNSDEDTAVEREDPNLERSSIKELATGYLRERESILKSVIRAASKTNCSDAENAVDVEQQRVQRQVQIWTDIATDLDGYYLEVLNKFLRIGRTTNDDLSGQTLITHRLSESAMDDLKRNRRKPIFRSQEDVHDDFIFGQLHGKRSPGVSTIGEFIEDLLVRTNKERQRAISFFDSEAVSEKETTTLSSKIDVSDGSDEDWNESSGVESSVNEDDKEDSSKLNRYSSERSVEDIIGKYRAFVAQQNEELENRREIIKKLQTENSEMMDALETYDEYKKMSEKQKEIMVNKVTESYESILEERDSKIKELENELMEHRTIDSVNEEKKGKRLVGQQDLDNNFDRLGKCFEKAYEQLKELASKANQTDAQSNAENDSLTKKIDDVDKRDTHDRFSKDFLKSSQIGYDDTLSFWISERLIQLCEKNKCYENCGANKHNFELKSSLKEYMDDLFARLFQAADRNEGLLRNAEMEAELLKSDLKKLKFQNSKTRRKLNAFIVKTQDLEADIAEKDELITTQSELFNQNEQKLDELMRKNGELNEKLAASKTELDSEREQTALLSEELRQSVVVEQEKRDENDRLIEFLIENSKKQSYPDNEIYFDKNYFLG